MKRLLGSSEVEAMAREKSVRGVLVRMAIAEAENADSKQIELLEEALQLLLARFREMEDETP